jgi:hypothetical protein
VKKARDLFLSRIPSDEGRMKVFNRKEIEKLHELTVDDAMMTKLSDSLNIDIAKLLDLKLCKPNCAVKTHNNDSKNCILAYLEKHPMFQILN